MKKMLCFYSAKLALKGFTTETKTGKYSHHYVAL